MTRLPNSGPTRVVPGRVLPTTVDQSQYPTSMIPQPTWQQNYEGFGMNGVVPPQPQQLPPGTGQIQTSITPRNVFSDHLTRAASNQAQADAQVLADPRTAMKQFDRPGVSRSAASLYRSMPSIVAALQQGAESSAGIPLADYATNQQNMMAGEVARNQEFQALANLLLQNQSIADFQRYGLQGLLAPLFNVVGRFF